MEVMTVMTRIAAAVLSFALTTPLLAQTEAEPHAWELRWNPPADLYEPYAADPRRSRHIISLINATHSNLPDSQNLRWGLSIGGTYGLARLIPRKAPDRAWQLEVEARFYGQYDIHYALDEIGHDGRLGGLLIKSVTDDVAVRLTFIHTSSHVGDEYILRNHLTERPSARREEVGTGISWKIAKNVRTYAEAGYGLNLGKGNRPMRVESGIEFHDKPRLGAGRFYAAVDATSFQENGWKVSTNLQTGVLFQSHGSDRKYRFGIELYRGRSQVDSFYRYHERYATIGMWLDL
jgi:hypothetical protein